MKVMTANVASLQQQQFPQRIHAIDSHTEGEPTRVVISGWPGLESGTLPEIREELRQRWDHLRSAVVCEPRGHDALVGALLTAPVTDGAAAGVVFFNNVGYLGMCGHGLIGVVRTLQHLGRLEPGSVLIDTPVGTVGAELHDDDSVTIRNVPAYCHAHRVEVAVPEVGVVVGDIAWGGNWFFISQLDEPAIELRNLDDLSLLARRIHAALGAQNITGAGGAEIDHIELTQPANNGIADTRNFVLCPGGAYDRSPCGTGTSAKLAVLHSERRLAPGQVWRQESITGGVFTAWFGVQDGRLIPYVRGRAYITGEVVLQFDARDPFRAGFTAA
ncbi:MAG TPA: proline racemase family protein [Longimicrobiales bacterium]